MKKTEIHFVICAVFALLYFTPQIFCKDDDPNETRAKRFQVFGGLSGTLVSGTNALGQSMINYGGDATLLGQVGKGISKVAKKAAGQIKYLLFTKDNIKNGTLVTTKTLKSTEFFDSTIQLIIIIHGYTMGGYFENPSDNLINLLRIKDGLLEAKIVANVIVVDWTGLSSDMTYVFSSTSTATVADDISDFIISAVKKKLARYKDIHIIGHSLGAQTAGITGRKVHEKTQKTIARIDGIDPAGPNFDTSHSQYQLGPTDAEFVQAIHCNMHNLGTALERGTVDFYPNGGNDMPGCEDITELVSQNVCNHVRCNDLYIEAIKDEKKGCPCETWDDYNTGKCFPCKHEEEQILGYHCGLSAKGKIYLNVTLKTGYQKYHDDRDSTTMRPDANTDY